MGTDIPLTWFLYFAAASFSIGLAGVLVRRNAIAVLMAIEIMLNAANVNLVAFWRYGPERPGGRADRRRHPGHLRADGGRGRGRRRHRPDPALLSPLACRRRRPLRQPGRVTPARATTGLDRSITLASQHDAALTPQLPRRFLPCPRDRPDGLGAAGAAGGPGPGAPDEPGSSAAARSACCRWSAWGWRWSPRRSSASCRSSCGRDPRSRAARGSARSSRHTCIEPDPVDLLRHARGRRAERRSSTSSTSCCWGWSSGFRWRWSFTEEWGEYFALMFWATVGMMLLTAAEELVTLFLTLETMTICLYLSTALEKTRRRSAEGGLKYFVYGSVSSALFLFGLSLLYGLTGTTQLDAIQQILLRRPGRRGPGGQRGRGHGGPADAGGLRVQGRGGAVPPVGARRLRRGAGAGDGLDRHRLEARQLRRADEGVPARAASRGRTRRRASWGRAGSASSRSSRP